MDLGLKSGKRSFDEKCKSKTKPGQHSKTSNVRSSNYNVQFREKQKLKRLYGISESQLTNCIRKLGVKTDNLGISLLSNLERRLDNVLYRMGFCATRAEARQTISHGFVLLNSRTNNLPSYRVEPGDALALKDKPNIRNMVQRSQQTNRDSKVPGWLEVNQTELKGTCRSNPRAEDLIIDVNEKLIVEFYSHLQ